MAARKAANATKAALGAGDQQAGGVDRDFRRVGQKSGEVVIEDKGGGVVRVPGSPRARVAGTEIAGGIKMWGIFRGRLLNFALPWALRAMGRDDDPLARERVEAAVGGVFELVEIHIVLSGSLARVYRAKVGLL